MALEGISLPENGSSFSKIPIEKVKTLSIGMPIDIDAFFRCNRTDLTFLCLKTIPLYLRMETSKEILHISLAYPELIMSLTLHISNEA